MVLNSGDVDSYSVADYFIVTDMQRENVTKLKDE